MSEKPVDTGIHRQRTVWPTFLVTNHAKGHGYFRSAGFPGGSDGKESSCDAGDPGLIPGLGMATHSSILAWRIPWTEDLAGYSPWGRKESDTTEAT